MTQKKLLNNINVRIKTNANGEITAEILNDILQNILLYLDDKIGDLDNGLNQSLEKVVDLVDVANTLQTQIQSNKIGLHLGTADPNQTPPESYATLDYYLQTDPNGNELFLWQYTEREWCKIANYIDDNAPANPFSTWNSHKIQTQLSAVQNNLQQQINGLHTILNNLQNGKGDRWIQLKIMKPETWNLKLETWNLKPETWNMTELIVNGKKLELPSDTKIKYTKQISDIFNIAKVNASYTNAFNVPKTPENTAVLDCLGLVGSQSKIPYQKTPVTLRENGIDLIKNGWLEVKETSDYYKINIIDGAIDFFKQIENSYLSDIDLSKIDHQKKRKYHKKLACQPVLPLYFSWLRR